MARPSSTLGGPPWDLRSDTITQPTERMRQAMAAAEVGDDVYKEDPTVARLEEEVAERLGMEAGLFFPSGTMANLCALLSHTRPGQTALLDVESHIAFYEAGGMARLAGVMPRFFPAMGRAPLPEELDPLVPPADDIHVAPAALLCLENTHARAGGLVMDVQETEAIIAWARRRGLRVHVDGARIFNAAVALECDPAALVRGADSAMVSLSKGLSAPVGSVLVGSRSLITEARRARKLVGGGMRQAGVLAAAGLIALEDIDRLHEDHRTATLLAEALEDLPSMTVRPAGKVRTNIVVVDIAPEDGAVPSVTSSRDWPASILVAALKERGVLVNALAPRTLRLVTHRYVPAEAVPQIVSHVRAALDDVRFGKSAPVR